MDTIFFGLSTAGLRAQDFKSIEPKKMQKDLTELLRIIEAHPDPFTHISEEAFMQRYEETRASCNTTHSIPEFYRKVAGLAALIRDGHTSVHMPEDWLLDLRKKYGGFPYEMYLDNDDRLYVLKNQHSGVIRPGSKVIAINGMATDSFIRAVDPMISHECKPFRNTILDGSFELYRIHTSKHVLNVWNSVYSFAKNTTKWRSIHHRSGKEYLKADFRGRHIHS